MLFDWNQVSIKWHSRFFFVFFWEIRFYNFTMNDFCRVLSLIPKPEFFGDDPFLL